MVQAAALVFGEGRLPVDMGFVPPHDEKRGDY
jgi:hypothetical protein